MKLKYAVAYPRYSRTMFAKKADMESFLKAHIGEGYIPQKRLCNEWYDMEGKTAVRKAK